MLLSIVAVKTSCSPLETALYCILADDRFVMSNGSLFSSIESSTGGYREGPQTMLHNRSFVALTERGDLLSWGHRKFGAHCDDVKDQLVNIKEVYHTRTAWAALKLDGSVITWGSPKCGGDCSKVRNLLNSVKSICSTESAFAALSEDGEVVTWGLEGEGGHCFHDFDDKVVSLHSTDHAFAALKRNGNVAVWGHKKFGGRVPDNKFLFEVKKIVANRGAFAALREDGAVVTWGREDVGGDFHLQKSLVGLVDGPKVIDLKASIRDFKVLLDDGSSLKIDYQNRGSTIEY